MSSFFTIGHSNRTLEEVVGLLAPNGVAAIVDVRRLPGSRTHPQFNAEVFAAALKRNGIGYEHVAALGGRRARSKDVAPEINAFWENQSFHNYADYAMGAEFRTGFERLLEVGGAGRCAVLCAEAVWWRCHRRIIADYLLAAGEEVFHIVSGDVPEPARMTPEAVARGDHIEYPSRQRGLI